jgi:hypothetical protein
MINDDIRHRVRHICLKNTPIVIFFMTSVTPFNAHIGHVPPRLIAALTKAIHVPSKDRQYNCLKLQDISDLGEWTLRD